MPRASSLGFVREDAYRVTSRSSFAQPTAGTGAPKAAREGARTEGTDSGAAWMATERLDARVRR
jgi:hypothetical protein